MVLFNKQEMVMFIDKKYQDVKRFVEKEEGGVFKRMDENRELFELLCREHPEVFRKNPWFPAGCRVRIGS